MAVHDCKLHVLAKKKKSSHIRLCFFIIWRPRMSARKKERNHQESCWCGVQGFEEHWLGWNGQVTTMGKERMGLSSLVTWWIMGKERRRKRSRMISVLLWDGESEVKKEEEEDYYYYFFKGIRSAFCFVCLIEFEFEFFIFFSFRKS